jgi:hypothetical protein
MAELIDIDSKPTVAHEFAANVVNDGGRPRLVPSDAGKWLATLSKLSGPVKVTIERPKKTRSQEASNYTWGVVYVDALAGLRQIAMDAGEECPFKNAEEFHSAMKYLCYGMEQVKLPGGVTVRELRQGVVRRAPNLRPRTGRKCVGLGAQISTRKYEHSADFSGFNARGLLHFGQQKRLETGRQPSLEPGHRSAKGALVMVDPKRNTSSRRFSSHSHVCTIRCLVSSVSPRGRRFFVCIERLVR